MRNFLLVAKARSVRMVSKIAFRNLMRQFRRNMLLGIGIAVSMCILVMTASFTNGLTDILFNKVMVYMTGHIRVIQDSYVTRRSDVIRDVPRFIQAIKENVPGIKRIDVTVSAFGRSIGNGKTGMVALVGIPRDADFYRDTQLEAGHTQDIFKQDVFPGIIMYKNAAKDINVRLNDIVTVRFDTVYGQSQAPKFKVVGLIPSENMFMDVAAFVDQDTLRTMLNLKPDEALGLNIVVDYPEDQRKVIAEANKLHAALAPEAAGVKALFVAGKKRAVGDAFALRLENDPAGNKDRPGHPAVCQRRPAVPCAGKGRHRPHADPCHPAGRGCQHTPQLQLRPQKRDGCGGGERGGDGDREVGSSVRGCHGVHQPRGLLPDFLLEPPPAARNGCP